MTGRRLLGCVVVAGALLAGCGTGSDDNAVTKVTEYTEPTASTPRPSPTRPTTTTTAPPTTSTSTPTGAPPGAEVLAPENGYVFIETKSGKTRCQIDEAEVGCEAQFTDAPEVDGAPANGVRQTADGQVTWVVGNLGDIPVVTLDYHTYSAVGWTIEAGENGTRFINQRTGHGMNVAVEKVDTF